MKKLFQFARDCRAAEVVELAAVLPILFTLIFGIFSFGRAYNIYSTITRAAQEGARVAVAPGCAYCSSFTCSSGPATFPFPCDDAVVTAVNSALAASHLDPNQITQPVPKPNPLACPAPALPKNCSAAPGSNVYICRNVVLNPTSTPQTCGAIVSFEYSYQFLPIPFLRMNTIQIPAEAQMRMEY